MFYTYIIKNSNGLYYKGVTANYEKRFIEHNTGLSVYTKSRGPWELIFVQEFKTLQEATKCEKRLKRCNKVYLDWLIKQPLNILDR